MNRSNIMKRLVVTTALVLVAGGALSQVRQPYADLQTRPIKALSKEQTADLRAGRGMGLALAAELNGYPGPLHVIELADRLELNADQRARMQQLFEKMKREAVVLGERLIAEEADLDRLFATRAVTPDTLSATTAAIGRTQAALRGTHLRYHLLTVAVLTSDQVNRYRELRGYKNSEPAPTHDPKLHGH